MPFLSANDYLPRQARGNIREIAGERVCFSHRLMLLRPALKRSSRQLSRHHGLMSPLRMTLMMLMAPATDRTTLAHPPQLLMT
jgi:hypothetical protein